jgi:peptidoglycan/xylan/chitin deacetylase (PgdA/CDA1 family)
MISRMAVKRTLKRAAGRASLALSPLATPTASAVCILVYHRVADIGVQDPDRDNWNVPPACFEQQMAALAGWADVVRLDRLPALLDEENARPSRPRVCVTFDDGFASVHAGALPILRHYRIPATVFVVTGYIGGQQPMPFDGWSRHNAARTPMAAWRPMNWDELEDCAHSGLVAVGAHSHEHLDARRCSPAQLVEEAARSRGILQARLGSEHARSYAYPYGSTRLGEVSRGYVDAVRAAGYERAVSTDLGLVTRRSDAFRLPRVEATAGDTPAVLRAKVRGSLLPLRVTDRLRRADRPF